MLGHQLEKGLLNSPLWEKIDRGVGSTAGASEIFSCRIDSPPLKTTLVRLHEVRASEALT